jgi:hypothetical protein
MVARAGTSPGFEGRFAFPVSQWQMSRLVLPSHSGGAAPDSHRLPDTALARIKSPALHTLAQTCIQRRV